ncbi:MAG: type 1 glutamine amidotransferase [Pseudomonadota bacterium]
MHLAVLMTNTDESDFAQKHPKDGEKFSNLISMVRPAWEVSVFAAKDGAFPDDITGFDGVIVTGSPASVHDPDPWVSTLLQQIRIAYAAQVPLFGACLGHQAIAVALGGTVVENPAGWGFGLIEMEVTHRPDWYDGPQTLLQYGAHIEHVTKLPAGAKEVFAAAHCANAGFVVGGRVYTTQNHPEMTPEFIAALVEELGGKMGPEVTATARASLSRTADTEVFAQSIARFFEQASAA